MVRICIFRECTLLYAFLCVSAVSFSGGCSGSGAKRRGKNAELMGLMVNDPALRPEQLFQIRQKTLVIAGTRDMTKKSHTELIARSIPNAELKFLKGDHFIAAKKPDEFNWEVGRF